MQNRVLQQDADKTSIDIKPYIGPGFTSMLQDIVDGRHRHYWLSGGRGSGKSSFVSLIIVSEMAKRKDANAVIFRKVEKTLRDSIVPQISWALDKLGLYDKWEYLAARNAFEEKETGRLILMRGLDNPMRTKGIKAQNGAFELIWFEELSEFTSMDEIRQALASVVRGCDSPLCLYTYNPPGPPGHWLNLEISKPRRDRLIHYSSYLDMPRDWLGEGFIAEAAIIRERDEGLWKRMYLGEASAADGAVFTNIRLREISDEERGLVQRIWNGLDFGFGASPDALARVGYDVKRRRLIILEEFWGIRTPSENLAIKIRKLCGRETVTCDSAEPRMIDTLRSRGVNARSAIKGPGSVMHGIRWLADRLEIIIDPETCPNAAREFTAYQYSQDRFGNFGAEPAGEDHHLIDAVRYAMEEVMAERAGRIFARE